MNINCKSGKRNTERVVYSNDGLIFVTYDHYHTFYEIIQEKTNAYRNTWTRWIILWIQRNNRKPDNSRLFKMQILVRSAPFVKGKIWFSYKIINWNFYNFNQQGREIYIVIKLTKKDVILRHLCRRISRFNQTRRFFAALRMTFYFIILSLHFWISLNLLTLEKSLSCF